MQGKLQPKQEQKEHNMIKNVNIAASQQSAVSRPADEPIASAFATQVAVTDEQEDNTNLRVIKIKSSSNARMFATLNKAIAAGATTLIVTPRIDIAGYGYVWFGIRKGQTELDGKLLVNPQIAAYLKAFLQGKELPAVSEFEPRKEICCQSEWLARVSKEIEKLTSTISEEYNESEEGIGYLSKKYHFPNGKIVMPAEAIQDLGNLLN